MSDKSIQPGSPSSIVTALELRGRVFILEKVIAHLIGFLPEENRACVQQFLSATAEKTDEMNASYPSGLSIGEGVTHETNMAARRMLEDISKIPSQKYLKDQ